MFKVINRFKDKDGHIYEVGDTYPAKGKKLVNTRAEFLTKVHPIYGVVFLEEIKDENSEKTPKNVPKTTRNTSKTPKNSQKTNENEQKSDETSDE